MPDGHPITVARAEGLLSRHLATNGGRMGGSMSEERGSLPLSESLEEAARCVTPPLTPTDDEISSNVKGGGEQKPQQGHIKKCKLLHNIIPNFFFLGGRYNDMGSILILVTGIWDTPPIGGM